MTEITNNMMTPIIREPPERLTQTAQFYLLHHDDATRHYVLFHVRCDTCHCGPDLAKFLMAHRSEIFPLADSPIVTYKPYGNNGIRCEWAGMPTEIALLMALSYKRHMILHFTGTDLYARMLRFRHLDDVIEDSLYTMTRAFLLFGAEK